MSGGYSTVQNKETLTAAKTPHGASQGKSAMRMLQPPLLWLALLLAVLEVQKYGWRSHHAWANLLLCALLVWQSYPVRSRSLINPTFPISLTFALAIWVSGSTAALAALASGLLLYLIAPAPAAMRLRYQGIRLGLAALLMPPLLAVLHPLTSALSALIAAAVFGAASFALEMLNPPVQGAYRFARMVRLWLPALCFGLPAVVLLTPLENRIGIATLLPLALLLLLAARLAAQSAEVRSLHRQLLAAEAMGRASVTQAEKANPTALLQHFLTLAAELVPAERSLIWMLNNESGELSPSVALPEAGPFEQKIARFGEGLIGHAAARIKPRLIPDAAADPYRAQREAASGAWLLYPIVVHGMVMGVAQWTRKETQPFTPEDIARLDALAPQASIALENISIRAQLLRMAETDGLTGLWNQRTMHHRLKEEVKRSIRYHRPMALLMLDVDSFKSFNDSYGHPAGDQMLCTIGHVLQASVRNVDHVGRFGGEEFLVILPETTKDAACQLGERIRKAVEERGYVITGQQKIHRTVSIGVAACPEDALNAPELLQWADKALYSAKRSGKNCVNWA